MLITKEQILSIAPDAEERKVAMYCGYLNETMDQYQIDSIKRMSAFIAQVAHESGSFRYVRELASGLEYEGRLDLGNNQHGDGVKFKGRGLIQITGRDNYCACGLALGLPLETFPAWLEEPEWACKSAGWFWTEYKKLNELADLGNFDKITQRINGGQRGADQRRAFYAQAMDVLTA